MRINKLKKTKFQNVYEVVNQSGHTSYIVRFKYLNKRYSDKNFTSLFGSTTAKKAFDKLNEIKVMLSQGENPFEKIQNITVDEYFNAYIATINNEDRYIKTTYYNKHIQKKIGKMSIASVEENHILKILNSSTLTNLSDRSKFTTKMILDPMFKMSIRDGKRTDNPLSNIKFKKNTLKKALHSRIITNEKDIVTTLYKTIQEVSDIQMKIVLLISLMTARRRSEILKLKWEDIHEDKIFASKDSTKTKIDDEYPLPLEIIELLKEYQVYNIGYIFNIHKDTVTKKFTKIVNNSSIEVVQGSSLTLHDSRHLFMSIMSLETSNTDLVDKCISHSKRETIKDTYLSFNYNERKKIFQRYWEILRGNDIKSEELETSKHTKITLEKLIEMFSDNLITKEEFLTMKRTLD